VAGKCARCPAQQVKTPSPVRTSTIGRLAVPPIEKLGGGIRSGHKAVLMFHKGARCQQHKGSGQEDVSFQARSFLWRMSQELSQDRA